MTNPRWLLALIALVVAVGVVAAIRARRIAAVEAEFAAGDRPVG